MPKGQKTLGRKMPNPIDIEVGKRIRVYRLQAGFLRPNSATLSS